MCFAAKTPKYEKPPSYNPELAPDQSGLYATAQAYAEQRGGGKRRSTALTGLRGLTDIASTTKRTVLG